ncbi:carbohydrate-binding module family 21 protein [Botryobasidium botryosum FD-172 SS1]|uniref:Carbohydrate-binding module family 21 protein n=1 Tax=Botryobasidium botryosum (strain FD-172 SS1) TaxID=930990 RepID=A0A067MSV0_BOTB1|nr:carbohydrate-binding module family 21 protein [Botryobasidium botryosum FD-172 SS1]
MPYVLPSPTVSIAALSPPTSPRNHRRTSSHDFDKSSAFAGFSSGIKLNTLKLTLPGRVLESDSEREGSPQTSHIPFPTLSPTSSSQKLSAKPRLPRLDTSSPSSSGSNSPSVSPTILKANGTPLKPSLKGSARSSPSAATRGPTGRSRSAPSTPSLHKNVHFPKEDELEDVVFFRKTTRPIAVSLGEADAPPSDSEKSLAPSQFAWPSSPKSDLILCPSRTSAIPALDVPCTTANVILEGLSLNSASDPPTLHGSVIVRNVAFSKNVAVRFSLDQWTTTSVVNCNYATSLQGLPPPFSYHNSSEEWDRFSFTIRLGYHEDILVERIMQLCVRYSVPGPTETEWWDNNGGGNYLVSFRRKSEARPVTETAQPAPQSEPLAPPPPLARSYSFPPLSVSGRSQAQLPRPSGLPDTKLKLSNYVPPAPSAYGHFSPPPSPTISTSSTDSPGPDTPRGSPGMENFRVVGGMLATEVLEPKSVQAPSHWLGGNWNDISPAQSLLFSPHTPSYIDLSKPQHLTPPDSPERTPSPEAHSTPVPIPSLGQHDSPMGSANAPLEFLQRFCHFRSTARSTSPFPGDGPASDASGEWARHVIV